MAHKILYLIVGTMLLSIVGAYFLPELLMRFNFVVPLQPYDSLLATSAAFIATMLAISFSISLFTVQHAASSYTPSLLYDYIKDLSTWAIFSILSFSVLFNLFALLLDWGQRAVYMSIILSIFSFVLLGFQFIHTSNMVSPINLIKRIKARAIKYIAHLPERVKKIIKELKPKTELERTIISNELYKWFRFHNDRTLHGPSEKAISQIVDIIQKSAQKRESETATSGLSAISDIAESYLTVRKDDITPEDRFIEHVYEQLRSVSNIALDNQDVFLLREIMKAFEKMGKYSAQLAVISIMPSSHHLTALSGHYIQEIGIRSAEKQLWDAAGQAVISLKEVGVTSINKNKDDALTVRKISELALLKNWFVSRMTSEAFGELLVASVRQMVNETRLGMHLEEIRETSRTVMKTLSPWSSHLALLPLFAPTSRSLFETSFVGLTFHTLLIKKGEFPEIQTRGREEYVKNVISDVIEALHLVGVEAAQNKNVHVALDVADSLYEIGLLCVREKFVTFKDHLRDELAKIVDSLKELYMIWGRNTSMLPGDIIDSLTILAFECMKHSHGNVASKTVSDLINLCRFTAKIEEYGYDAARIADKIQMIGVFAAEKDQTDIAADCIEKLKEYDTSIVKLSKEHIPRQTIEALHEKYRKRGEEYGRELLKDPEREFFNSISDESFYKFKMFEKQS